MGKILAITSGKGGVGKSSVAVCLATAFARMGKKTLLVDMDEGLRCLDLMLGIDDATVLDLSDVLSGKDIDDACYPTPLADNLFLIPAPLKFGTIDGDAFENFSSKASYLYDIVIFDFSAGLDFSLYKRLPKTALFLTVCVPDPVSIRDAAAVSRSLFENDLNARLIINRFVYSQCKKHTFKNIDNIIDSAELRLLGIVPEDDDLRVISLTHKLKKRNPAYLACLRIAKRLLGEGNLLPRLKDI
jgi:septum site-determining protein MinD